MVVLFGGYGHFIWGYVSYFSFGCMIVLFGGYGR